MLLALPKITLIKNASFAYNKNMKKWAILLITAFIFTVTLAGYKTFLSITHPVKYENIIIESAVKFKLPPPLIASVINVESGYNLKAVSPKKALGLMQIKLDTANYLISYYKLDEQITEADLLTVQTNIKYGCMYLNYLMNKFNDLTTVLASYNAGETRVISWLKSDNYSANGKTLNSIPYLETSNYVAKVKNNLKFYSKVF